MKFRKPLRNDLLASCSDLSPEDGQDPRTFFRKPSGKVANRKALQLCGQVARTLSGVLAGECGDPVLREVLVESVRPFPDSAHLLVTVVPASFAEAMTAATVLDHLHRAGGLLRREVAAAIHRKRAPQLLFRVALSGAANS
jgi:ribosome-binding factor A